MLHLPPRTVRLRLTLLYSGLFLVSGLALLAATYFLFRSNTGVDLIVPPGTAHGSIVPGGRNGASPNPNVLRQVRRMLKRRLPVTATVFTRASSSPELRWRS